VRLALALSTLAAAIAVTAVWVVGDDPRDADESAPKPTFIAAATIESAFAADGGSQAEWVAMHPQLWWRQIQMICDISTADPRRYERQLRSRFRASVLERLRSECKT
jgi:hypothetical protein